MGSRFSDNVPRVSRIANLSCELAISDTDSIASDKCHYLDIKAAQNRGADIHLLR